MNVISAAATTELTVEQKEQLAHAEHVRLQTLSHLAQLRVEIAFMGEQLRTLASTGLKVPEVDAYQRRYLSLLLEYKTAMECNW